MPFGLRSAFNTTMPVKIERRIARVGLWRQACWYALGAAILFCLVTVAGFVRRPNAFTSFRNGVLTWDAKHYHTIAADGYLVEDPGLGAFAPLWPLLLRATFSQKTLESSGLPSSLLAFGLFCLSMILFARKVEEICPRHVVIAMLLSYALNPLSFFHAQPYSESLYCLVGTMLIFFLPLTEKDYRDYTWPRSAGIVFTSFLLSLTRNVPVQLMLSSIVALALSYLPRPEKHKAVSGKNVITTVLILAGAFAGMMVYGYWNLSHYGAFFHAFTIQSHWDQKLGIDFRMLYAPTTWTPSFKILLWDLLGFYLPIVVFVYPLAQRGMDYIVSRSDRRRNTGERENLTYAYLFWFAASVAASHSAIVFLTRPDFHAMARYTFAAPFIFFACACLFAQTSRKVALAVLIPWIVLSIVYLANWWGRYGRGAWNG